jgi:hypothetical protein
MSLPLIIREEENRGSLCRLIRDAICNRACFIPQRKRRTQALFVTPSKKIAASPPFFFYRFGLASL